MWSLIRGLEALGCTDSYRGPLPNVEAWILSDIFPRGSLI